MRAQAGLGVSGNLGADGGGVLEPPNALGVVVHLVQGSLTVLWCGGTGEAIRRGRTRGRSRRRGAGGLGPCAAPRPHPCCPTTAPSLATAAAALTSSFSVGSAPAASSFCTVDGCPLNMLPSTACISGVCW